MGYVSKMLPHLPALLCWILLATIPGAATAQSLQGSWALEVEDAAIFRFDLEREGDEWRGTWTRPIAIDSDGDRFAGFSRQAVEVSSTGSDAVGEWAELTFTDPRPGAVPDVFRFRAIRPNQAEMIYVGTGWAPYMLTRVPSGTSLGPFEIGKVYRREGVRPSARPLPSLFSSPDAIVPGVPSASEPAVRIEPPEPEPPKPEVQKPEPREPAMIGR